ncbi:hypothetical protein D3C87_204670 [compost metagenome]
MLRFNLFQKFMLVYCVSIAIASCSADESLTADVSPQNQVLSRTSEEEDLLKETNLIFEKHMHLKGINIKSTITQIDNQRPVHFRYYLSKMNKRIQYVEETTRVSFSAENELEQFDVFVIKYKEADQARSMVIIENKYFDNTLIYDGGLVDYAVTKPEIQIHEIESPIYVANKVRFSSACYKRCIGAIQDDITIWHFGLLAVCTPCAAAGAAYVAAAVLGCAGGCFVTVWEK